MIVRDKSLDKFHSKSMGVSDLEVENAKAICINETENHRCDNETTRSGSENFLVKYQDRTYNIQNFLNYHPGGKKTLRHYKDHILDKVLMTYPHSKSAYYLLEDYAVNPQERYNEYENLIDWDAPILRQVGLIGDRYWEWVNLPINRRIRLFESEILEMLSVTPWYIVPIVWLPITTYFFYMGCVLHASTNIVLTLQRILLSFAFGIFMWTLMEYFVHRKIFHFKPPDNSRLLITLHFLFHGIHHKAPLDRQRLVFPPIFSVLVAAIVWHIYKAIFPLMIVYFVATGSATGYLCYDLMHYYLHNGAPKFGSYLYTMKRRHNYHHFSYHNQGYGITSELWDRILKTDVILRKLNEPLEW